MKKLFIFLTVLIFFIPGYAQITDDSLRNYTDANIVTNGVRSITGAMMNTIFNDLIDSKVNPKEITSGDSDSLLVKDGGNIFYILYDYKNDTLFIGSDTIPFSSGDEDFFTNYTPTLSWTGTAPTINSTVAKYRHDDDQVNFIIYINFTSGISPPTNLNISLPVTPDDISIPILGVTFHSRTGSTHSKGEFPYIDCDNPTGSSRKLYFGNGFSLVAETTYGWVLSGFYMSSQ